MSKDCWPCPYFDPKFDTLSERIYGPPCRVSIDNQSMEGYTLVKANGVNKQGVLLDLVQFLTDMNLQICKSNITSDACWFMDVFHVRDEHGNKLINQKIIDYIQQNETFGKGLNGQHTAIEMTGDDRPGLFSEISAALADLHCNIVEAHAWSHNAKLACIAYISDQSTNTPIDDPSRLVSIEDHLTTVLRATTDPNGGGTNHPCVKTSKLLEGGEGTKTCIVEQRLHQLMLSVRDFDDAFSNSSSKEMGSEKRMVTIESCDQKRYSVVNVECKDRPRLMFDTVCTLTDMDYVIFHGSTRSHAGYAFQEYFIRHIDGYALNTTSEKERVIKCIKAAIEHRVCEGVRLELCANNRVGLLSDITRVLREHGLVVVRADVETHGEKSMNAFYVRDISGNKIDIEYFRKSVKRELGLIVTLDVKNNETSSRRKTTSTEKSRLSFGGRLRSGFERLSHGFMTE